MMSQVFQISQAQRFNPFIGGDERVVEPNPTTCMAVTPESLPPMPPMPYTQSVWMILALASLIHSIAELSQIWLEHRRSCKP
jgi:hypothetical protein